MTVGPARSDQRRRHRFHHHPDRPTAAGRSAGIRSVQARACRLTPCGLAPRGPGFGFRPAIGDDRRPLDIRPVDLGAPRRDILRCRIPGRCIPRRDIPWRDASGIDVLGATSDRRAGHILRLGIAPRAHVLRPVLLAGGGVRAPPGGRIARPARLDLTALRRPTVTGHRLPRIAARRWGGFHAPGISPRRRGDRLSDLARLRVDPPRGTGGRRLHDPAAGRQVDGIDTSRAGETPGAIVQR